MRGAAPAPACVALTRAHTQANEERGAGPETPMSTGCCERHIRSKASSRTTSSTARPGRGPRSPAGCLPGPASLAPLHAHPPHPPHPAPAARPVPRHSTSNSNLGRTVGLGILRGGGPPRPPAISTCSALPWIVGSTRRKLGCGRRCKGQHGGRCSSRSRSRARSCSAPLCLRSAPKTLLRPARN